MSKYKGFTTVLRTREQDFRLIEAKDTVDTANFYKRCDPANVVSSCPTVLTFWRDEDIVFIVGFTQPWDSVREVWMFPSKHVDRYPIAVVRACRQLAKEYFHDDPSVVRFQALCEDTPELSHWIRVMGFELEGLLRRYSPDKRDYNMWSQVKDGN